jgi:hypothetical protein
MLFEEGSVGIMVADEHTLAHFHRYHHRLQLPHLLSHLRHFVSQPVILPSKLLHHCHFTLNCRLTISDSDAFPDLLPLPIYNVEVLGVWDGTCPNSCTVTSSV